MGNLRASQGVLAQHVLHILLKHVLQLHCLLQQQADVLVDSLQIDVGRVNVGLGREVVKKVHLGFSTGNVWEFYLFSLAGLRVAVFETPENVEKAIV